MNSIYFKSRRFDKTIKNTLSDKFTSGEVSCTKRYIYQYEREMREIDFLIKQGKEVIYSKNDNYIIIEGRTYNGFGRKEIAELTNTLIKKDKEKEKNLIKKRKALKPKIYNSYDSKTTLMNKIILHDNSRTHKELYTKTKDELLEIIDKISDKVLGIKEGEY